MNDGCKCRDGKMLTEAEWKMIRKALQIVQMAHLVTETADGKEYRDTSLDELIRKVRVFEEGLTYAADSGSIDTGHKP